MPHCTIRRDCVHCGWNHRLAPVLNVAPGDAAEFAVSDAAGGQRTPSSPRKASETDARGVVSTYGYDTAGRLVSVVQSGITTPTAYSYDETNARTAQRDAAGREVQWRYDAAGRPSSRILPDGASESFTYDAEGRLTVYSTFGGQSITRSYDIAGRETSRAIAATVNAPARTISWTYNADGQRATQTDVGSTSSQGATTYTYDAQGRLAQLAGPQGTLGWTYDAADRITRRSTSEGNTDYTYDGDGRLTRLVAPDGKATTYTYDTAGRLLRSEQVLDVAAGVDLVTERRHDAQDRLVAIAHQRRQGGVSTLLAGQAISLSAGGAVNRIDTFGAGAAFVAASGGFSGNPVRAQIFGYDANARLTSERNYKGAQLAAFLGNPAATATEATGYVYDSVGNRTAKTVTTAAGTDSTSYSYDNNDRLTGETLTTATASVVATTYTWDGNGNLASKSTPSEYTGYVFDADNRLVEVRRGPTQGTATAVASYGYDGDGQRIRKTTASGSTRYLIDPTTQWPQVVLESSGAQATAYVWGEVLRQQATGSAGTAATAPGLNLIPLPGHLNTTLAAIDAAGAVVETNEASAFGELVNPNPALRHQFTGEYWEAEAALTYLRSRWYVAPAARFANLDPWQGRRADPRSLNRYVYAHGNPVENIDPGGEMSMASVGAGLSGLAILSMAAINVSNWWKAPPAPAGNPGWARPGVWDAIAMVMMRSATDAATEAKTEVKKKKKETEGHHTIPVMLCGSMAQELSEITPAEHDAIHAGISHLYVIKRFSEDYATKLVFGPNRNPEIVLDVARTPEGRGAIANALHFFYEPTWSQVGTRPIGQVFASERRQFVDGKTSLPWCSRNGSP